MLDDEIEDEESRRQEEMQKWKDGRMAAKKKERAEIRERRAKRLNENRIKKRDAEDPPEGESSEEIKKQKTKKKPAEDKPKKASPEASTSVMPTRRSSRLTTQSRKTYAQDEDDDESS